MTKELITLLIDDSTTDGQEFRNVLDTINPAHRLIRFREGENAVLHFSSPGFDVPDFIFIDALLPGISSFETAFRLRSIPLLAKVPIIIYSSVQPSVYEDVALIMGATYCIQKKELEVFRSELTRLLVASLPYAKTIVPKLTVAA